MRSTITSLGALFLLLAPAKSQDSEVSFRESTRKQDAAAVRGLGWLVKNQNKNGLWGCQKSGAPSAAITGLAILSLASDGSTPTKGRWARPLRKGLERLLKCQTRSTGQITLHDSTGMGPFYDHATATLTLAELYGSMQDEKDDLKVRKRLLKAIQYLYRTQGKDGGWDKAGTGGPSNLAITCAVWMSLRSAHNAGLEVEKANLKKLLRFVRNCAMPSGKFAITPTVRGGGGLIFYPTAAGLRILYGMGHKDSDEVVRGTKLLVQRKMGMEHKRRVSEWDYCGAFYAVQALLHEEGDAWKMWYPKIRDQLVEMQNEDGSWTIEYCLCCRAYATALAVLCLQAPKRMLPIFQL